MDLSMAQKDWLPELLGAMQKSLERVETNQGNQAEDMRAIMLHTQAMHTEIKSVTHRVKKLESSKGSSLNLDPSLVKYLAVAVVLSLGIIAAIFNVNINTIL